MKEDSYTIENLIKTFGKHHEKVQKDNEDLQRRVESGEIELQEWMKDPFCLPLALQSICKEIKCLKEKYER